jgi:G patch domain-containing protein 1
MVLHAAFTFTSDVICPPPRFSLPDIPKGWSPDPKRVWEKYKENVDTSAKKENHAPSELGSAQHSHAKWKTGISADEVRHT